MISTIKSFIGLGSRGESPQRPRTAAGSLAFTNTINEIQFLQGHTDIVRHLVKIDQNRIASTGDDGNIIIWNSVSGERLMILKGHKLAITCLLLLKKLILVSGSADKTIKIWNLVNGECMHTLTGHAGSIKCLEPLEDGRFCSGANDRQLIMWNTNGEEQGRIERQEEENLHCMLAIPDKRLVTGSNSSFLLVYKTDKLAFHRILHCLHHDSVRCLHKISKNLFASGSLDGVIVIWNSETLNPMKKVNDHDKYVFDKIYVYSVYRMVSFQNYLAATVGKGFAVFDVDTGECIVYKPNAHEAEVQDIIFLYKGARIVTCSIDGSIKVWSGVVPDKVITSNNPATPVESPKQRVQYTINNPKLDLVALGEMWVHTSSVNELLPVNEWSFASASSDNCVVLWKDGIVQSELRNSYAAACLMKYQQTGTQASYSDDDSYYSDDPMSPRRHSAGQAPKETNIIDQLSSMDIHVSNDPANPKFVSTLRSRLASIENGRPSLDQSTDGDDEAEQLSRTASQSENLGSEPEPHETAPTTNGHPPPPERPPAPVSMRSSGGVFVPEYLMDRAETLSRERKMSISDISNHLREAGHSEAIVNELVAKLQEQQDAPPAPVS